MYLSSLVLLVTSVPVHCSRCCNKPTRNCQTGRLQSVVILIFNKGLKQVHSWELVLYCIIFLGVIYFYKASRKGHSDINYEALPDDWPPSTVHMNEIFWSQTFRITVETELFLITFKMAAAFFKSIFWALASKVFVSLCLVVLSQNRLQHATHFSMVVLLVVFFYSS